MQLEELPARKGKAAWVSFGNSIAWKDVDGITDENSARLTWHKPIQMIPDVDSVVIYESNIINAQIVSVCHTSYLKTINVYRTLMESSIDHLKKATGSIAVQAVVPQIPEYINETISSSILDPAIEASVGARLAELKELGEEEGILWSQAAELQLWAFLRSMDLPSRPAIAIDSNGDIRALWHNLICEQVGLRFRGAPEIEAILFGKTEHGMRRETVRAEPEAILNLVREMKLVHVTRG